MPWSFKVSRGWQPYKEEQSAILDAAYAEHLAGSAAHANLGGTWRVDFVKMVQYRADDPGRQRAVQCEGAMPAAKAPRGRDGSAEAPRGPDGGAEVPRDRGDVEAPRGRGPRDDAPAAERDRGLRDGASAAECVDEVPRDRGDRGDRDGGSGGGAPAVAAAAASAVADDRRGPGDCRDLGSGAAVASSSTAAPAPEAAATVAADPAADGRGDPAAKRRRLLEHLLTASNDELTEAFPEDVLAALGARLTSLAKMKAPGHATAEPCVVWFRSDFNKTYGEDSHGSATHIRTGRLFAKVGTQLVVFWLNVVETPAAEAEETDFKLSFSPDGETEGDLLFPPAPYTSRAEGGDGDMLWMPLPHIEAIRARCGCGCAEDPRPANVWLGAAFSALSAVAKAQLSKDLGEGIFETIGEMQAERFSDKYLPSRLCTTMEMLKEKGMAS